jgi:hypothetical protein
MGSMRALGSVRLWPLGYYIYPSNAARLVRIRSPLFVSTSD